MKLSKADPPVTDKLFSDESVMDFVCSPVTCASETEITCGLLVCEASMETASSPVEFATCTAPSTELAAIATASTPAPPTMSNWMVDARFVTSTISLVPPDCTVNVALRQVETVAYPDRVLRPFPSAASAQSEPFQLTTWASVFVERAR